MSLAPRMIEAADALRDAVDALQFPAPIAYAWLPHRAYLQRYAHSPRRTLFLGMNPGPWGMAQTGVPFGEVQAVKGWMGIDEPVDIPFPEHPKRPVLGFACQKSEVSGRRLWGLFAERFRTPQAFFQDHFVINFCPLVFMEDSARNFTPDKLPAAAAAPLYAACQAHLRRCAEILQAETVVGVGAFAQQQAAAALQGLPIRIAQILHPSPASPAANRGWAAAATAQLTTQNIWPPLE